MSIFNSLLPGAAGLEFEMGTWTPASDVARGTIPFSKSHNKPPSIVAVAINGSPLPVKNTGINFLAVDYSSMLSSIPIAAGLGMYARTEYTSGNHSDCAELDKGGSDPDASDRYCFRYYADENAMYPENYNSSSYWRKTKVYNWIAIWT